MRDDGLKWWARAFRPILSTYASILFFHLLWSIVRDIDQNVLKCVQLYFARSAWIHSGLFLFLVFPSTSLNKLFLLICLAGWPRLQIIYLITIHKYIANNCVVGLQFVPFAPTLEAKLLGRILILTCCHIHSQLRHAKVLFSSVGKRGSANTFEDPIQW